MPRATVSRGGRRLRAVGPGDIEAIRLWRNTQMEVLRQARPISAEDQISYYQQNIWPSFEQPQPANILLAYEEDESLIGYGGLVHIAWEHRRAELSFLLQPELTVDPAVYGAYFADFLLLVRELAFHDLGMERVWTETYALRRHHIGVLETAGFKREGVMRRHVVINEGFVDSLIHGCLRDDN